MHARIRDSRASSIASSQVRVSQRLRVRKFSIVSTIVRLLADIVPSRNSIVFRGRRTRAILNDDEFTFDLASCLSAVIRKGRPQHARSFKTRPMPLIKLSQVSESESTAAVV